MKSFSVSEVLGWLAEAGLGLEPKVENEDWLGAALPAIRVCRPSALVGSTADSVAFFFARAFQHELPMARPGILVTGRDFVAPLRAAGIPWLKGAALISCRDPYLGMAVISRHLAPLHSRVAKPEISASAQALIHPQAVVSPLAKIGVGSRIDATVVIEDEATIGENVRIYPGCYIGHGVKIGAGSVLFPNVTVYERTEIGARVRLHSGVVLGADGFGYAAVRNEQGEVLRHEKIFHLGKVILGDDVEIGALSSVDRGTFADTRIGNGVKIDNNVQVGHNSQVDEGAIMCGSSGLAGSAQVGKFAYIGGMAGVANQVVVGDRAMVGGLTLVSKDVQPGTSVIGNPQREYREHFKLQARLNKMMRDKKKDE